MKKSNFKYYGFWMLLEEDSEKVLTDIINGLCKKYVNNKSFVPHVSVYKSMLTDLEASKRLVDEIVSDIKPFDLEVERIEYQDNDWSKTLYLKFKDNLFLRQISHRFEKEFGETYTLFPHLSLVYSTDMTAKDKQKEITTLDLPKKIRLSRICIVNPHSENNDWQNYQDWMIDYIKNL